MEPPGSIQLIATITQNNHKLLRLVFRKFCRLARPLHRLNDRQAATAPRFYPKLPMQERSAEPGMCDASDTVLPPLHNIL
jgi:hypothetical protein